MFRNVDRGYWYRVRGKNCDGDLCSPWSGYSTPIEFSDPTVAVNDLTTGLVEDTSDAFTVAASDLTIHQQYTISLASNSGDIGFSTSCGQASTQSFTPTTDLAQRGLHPGWL